MINKKKFFDEYRKNIDFNGKLDNSEVIAIDFILDKINENFGYFTTPQWAYVLATAFHETNHTLLPIKEIGGYKYFMKMYDVSGNRPNTAKKYGNTTIGDGAKYYGRGYVQITWKVNYAYYAKLLGIDLINNPDLAQKSEYAWQIMVHGFKYGTFTGKKISDYISGSKKDYLGARRVINGIDKAALIKGYAEKFEAAILKSV